MIKIKKLLFTFIFCIGFVNNAFAHTGLEDSTPKDGEVIKEPIQQLTLNFATKIEQTSTIKVLKSNGETVNLGNFVIEDSEMWANFLEPLENGEYQVTWKIIGADGHPIEGEFIFSVDVPVTEQSAEVQEKTQSQSNDDENIDKVNEIKSEDIQQNKLPSYALPSIIGVLIVIIVGSFFLIMKRKK